MAVKLDSGRRYKAGDNTSTWIHELSHNVVTPAYLLRRLAASADPELRIAVADHLNTTEEVLLILADDENSDVRYAMAENHNMSRNVLNKLCDDANPYVAQRAQKTVARIEPASESSTPPLVIDRFVFSTIPAPVAGRGLHTAAELRCKLLLARHAEGGQREGMKVVRLLHSLAQALEGQAKYAEGRDTRLRARNILISLMTA